MSAQIENYLIMFPLVNPEDKFYSFIILGKEKQQVNAI